MGTYGTRIQQALRAEIRAEIAAKDWKQADVCRMTGMETSTLSRYLKDGYDRDMPVSVAAELAQVLGFTLAGLLERVERRAQELS